MYTFIDSHDYKNKNVLIEIPSVLCKYLNFDNWKIISFTKDKFYGYIMHSSNTDSEESEKIFFDRSTHKNFLQLLLEKRSPLLCKRSEQVGEYDFLYDNSAVELYFPLISTHLENDIIGCLCFSKTSPATADIEDLVAKKFFISRMTYMREIYEAHYKRYVSRSNFFNLLHVFSEVIKTKDPFMTGHPYNVAFLCHLIGLELNFSMDRLYKLYIASILHDVGKVYVPDSILNKHSPLDDKERAEIKKHSMHGYNIIKDLGYELQNLHGIEDIVLQHHERYDGTGYPNGIQGD